MSIVTTIIEYWVKSRDIDERRTQRGGSALVMRIVLVVSFSLNGNISMANSLEIVDSTLSKTFAKSMRSIDDNMSNEEIATLFAENQAAVLKHLDDKWPIGGLYPSELLADPEYYDVTNLGDVNLHRIGYDVDGNDSIKEELQYWLDELLAIVKSNHKPVVTQSKPESPLDSFTREIYEIEPVALDKKTVVDGKRTAFDFYVTLPGSQLNQGARLKPDDATTWVVSFLEFFGQPGVYGTFADGDYDPDYTYISASDKTLLYSLISGRGYWTAPNHFEIHSANNRWLEDAAVEALSELVDDFDDVKIYSDVPALDIFDYGFHLRFYGEMKDKELFIEKVKETRFVTLISELFKHVNKVEPEVVMLENTDTDEINWPYQKAVDTRSTDSVTNLLKVHAAGISAVKANKSLIRLGLLEERERESSTKSGVMKKYKAFTVAGEKYGVNEQNEKYSDQTTPRFYVDVFVELLELIRDEIG